MEGFLDIYWCLFWYIICIPFLIIGARRLRRLFSDHPEMKLSVAISGAFIFVLSSLKLPSISGSSSHPTGTGLSTMLSGPFITSILATIVLIFQALLLAHGGLTTLGANVFSMGIVGPFAAYGCYRLMSRANVHPVANIFITAFVADMATYMMTSFQLALAYPSSGSVVDSMSVFLGIFAVTQVPLAVVESVLLVMFFEYLSSSRPELLKGSISIVSGRKISKLARALVGTVIVVSIVAIPFLLYESHAFEGTDEQGGEVIQEIDPTNVQWVEALFTPPSGSEPYLFLLQGCIGIAVILAVIFVTRRRKRGRSHGCRTRCGMDEMAQGSPMKDLPPLGKLILTLSLLVVSLASGNLLAPLIVLGIGIGMLFHSTRFRFPRVLAVGLLDGLAVIFVGCLIIALLTGGGSIIWGIDLFGLRLVVHQEGLDLAVLVLFRALAGMTVMLAFMTSTPIPHFALALRQLRVPREVSELTVLVYRYSFLLLEQLDTMTVAAMSRLGFKGVRTTVRTSSKLAVNLFSRSMEMADRSQIALQCRNFNGDFPTFRPPARLGRLWVFGPVLLAVAIFLASMMITEQFDLG